MGDGGQGPNDLRRSLDQAQRVEEALEDAARAGFYAQRELAKRAYHELIGLSRGILLDGEVSPGEVEALDRWCSSFPEVTNTWPGRIVAKRVREVLADGHVDPGEQRDLKLLLEQLTGDAGDGVFDQPTKLPLNDPMPAITVVGRSFCFTGTFVYGSREACRQVVRDAGGQIAKSVVKALDYLVIGARVTPAWVHSTHGRKIEKAVKYRDQGVPLVIVDEPAWTAAVDGSLR